MPPAFISNLAWQISAGIHSILAVVYWILVFIKVGSLLIICDSQAHILHLAIIPRAYNTRDKCLKC